MLEFIFRTLKIQLDDSTRWGSNLIRVCVAYGDMEQRVMDALLRRRNPKNFKDKDGVHYILD